MCKILLISCLLLLEVVSQELNNTQKILSDDSSFNFDDFDQNGQNKALINLNHNCSTHDDCTAKHSICDSILNTCECDITSMQSQSKCRVIYCQSNEECSIRFSDSLCTFGRCQCLGGHKVNGKCLKGMASSFTSGPLPDWAIISIAVTLCLSVIAGGSFKKNQLKAHLMRLIQLFLQRGDGSQNQNSDESEEDIEASPSVSTKKGSKSENIELTEK